MALRSNYLINAPHVSTTMRLVGVKGYSIRQNNPELCANPIIPVWHMIKARHDLDLTIALYDNQPLEVALKHIRYIQGNGNYSLFHRSNGRPILVSQTLKRWQEKLPTFVRISQGCLLNPAFIDWTHLPSRKNPTLRLTNGDVLVIARRRLTPVFKFIDEQLATSNRALPSHLVWPIKSPLPA